MIGVLRWVVGIAAGLAAFFAAGIFLSANDSDTVATFALLLIGVAVLAVLAYVLRAVVRGPR